MKIRELINFLTSVDDPEADVVVAYFQTSGIIAELLGRIKQKYQIRHSILSNCLY